MNAPKLAGSARLILALTLILLPLALLAAGPAQDEEGEGVAAEPEAGAESEAAAPADGEAASASDLDAEAGPEVIVARIDSAIQVVVAEFMEQVTTEADLARAEALIVELSTPGRGNAGDARGVHRVSGSRHPGHRVRLPERRPGGLGRLLHPARRGRCGDGARHEHGRRPPRGGRRPGHSRRDGRQGHPGRGGDRPFAGGPPRAAIRSWPKRR